MADDPKQILDARLARGEISIEEYDQLKERITSSNANHATPQVETSQAYPGQPQGSQATSRQAGQFQPYVYKSTKAVASTVVSMCALSIIWSLVQVYAYAKQMSGLMFRADLFLLFATLILLVSWCIWIYRISANLRVLGAHDMRYSPGWAVGWYFIPVLNLWMPLLVMREIWRRIANFEQPNSYQSTTLVVWWWIVSIFLPIAGILLVAIGVAGAPNVSEKNIETIFTIAFAVLTIPGYVFTFVLVRALTNRQSRLAESKGVF